MRGLFGLTGEFVAGTTQIKRGQGGARLEHNDVTCGAMTAVGSVSVRRARMRLMGGLLVRSGVSESFASGGNQGLRCTLPG